MKIIDMAKFYFGQYETLKVNGEYATGLCGRDKVYKSLDEFLAIWEGWADMEVVKVSFQTVYTSHYNPKLGHSVPDGDFEIPYLYFMYR